MNSQQQQITDLNSLLAAADKAGEIFGNSRDAWWRGHARIDWDLAPKLYRTGYDLEERNLAIRFMNMARVRYDKIPGDEDWPSWLFLMQHYGLPTRLLDWTDSPLVALYFAVSEAAHHNEGGALWAIQPTRLNKIQAGQDVIACVQEPEIGFLALEAFQNVEPERRNKRIVAVLPNHFDMRHLVQSAAFTIHGCGEAINRLGSSDSFLVKFEIPAEAKQRLLRDLRKVGIHEASLFPDLDHLSRHLTSTKFLRGAQ